METKATNTKGHLSQDTVRLESLSNASIRHRRCNYRYDASSELNSDFYVFLTRLTLAVAVRKGPVNTYVY